MIALLIDHLWQSTLVALAAAALAFALRNHGARARYWVWFAASMKLAVPFAALVALGNTLEWRAAAVAEPSSPSAAIDWVAIAEQVAQPMKTLAPAVAPAVVPVAPYDRSAFAALVGAVWLGGFAVVLGVWLVRGLRLNRLLSAATPLADERFANLGVEVRLSASKIEPGIVGIFRPVLVLPDGILQRLSAQQLDAVIAHELCHVRRRDNFTAALFWFHPLVWWIGARLVEEREHACDEAVVAAGADPHAYAEGILEVCRLYVESPLPCAAGIGGGATLQSRVRRLAERWSARSLSRAWRGVLALAALVVLGAPVVIGAVTAPRLLAQPATANLARFDYASIAEAGAGERRLIRMSGTTFEASNESLRQLIAFAYDVQLPQIDGPAAIDSRRYRISATAPGPALLPSTETPAMLRTLLDERFGLVVHQEIQRMPTLVLARVRDGVSPLSAAERRANPFMQIRPGSLELTSAPLRLFTSLLAQAFDKPVVDEPRLGGEDDVFSFTLQWEPGVAEAGQLPDRATLARALEEQLGLSLREAERPVERLIVDALAEQPVGLWVPPSPGAQ